MILKSKKNISDLEGWSWTGEVPDKNNSSYEEFNFYNLHRKPLNLYTVEDVYFMIGQESGLKYFVPSAIKVLANDLLIKADDYNGDLLCRLLKLESSYWVTDKDSRKALEKILKSIRNIDDLELSKNVRIHLKECITSFA